jgi:uncharacterized membrane protein YfcA
MDQALFTRRRLLGAGAALGGLVGAPFARRLPDPVLRGVIVAVGLVAAVVSIVRY